MSSVVPLGSSAPGFLFLSIISFLCTKWGFPFLRLDKWLKVSRLIKRRTVAQMACEQGRVYINDKPAKSASTVREGDKVHIELGSRALTIKVLSVPLKAPRANVASETYEVLEEIRRPPEILEWLPDDEMW